MECPRCNPGGGGLIYREWVEPLQADIFVCIECDAVWRQREAICAIPEADYQTFMEALGLEPVWDYVEENLLLAPHPNEGSNS